MFLFKLPLKKLVLVSALALVILSLAALPSGATERTLAVKGVAVTGPNSLLGQQVRDFGPGISTGSELVAAYNPGASEPLPLAPDTPLSTPLATIASSVAGVDPALFNLPLREVPGNISNSGLIRDSLPGQLAVGTFDANQSEPSSTITLGDWLQATGHGVFKCTDDGRGSLDLLVQGLVPNRLFTVWGIFLNGQGAVPVGGAPNVIMTDEHGDGRFHRSLSFCPLDPTSEGAQLLYLVVVFHSDQQVYATKPTLPDAGYPPGIVAHPQLQFSIQGEPLLP